MRKCSIVVLLVVLAALAAPSASFAQFLWGEYVTGGSLDQAWMPGFGLSNVIQPRTLAPGDPGYDNPSADHTVGVLTNTDQTNGGIALSCASPGSVSDYVWEARVYTGDGDTRRGIVVRANPDNSYASCYQLVFEQGLLQVRFRKLIDSAPTTLGSWFVTGTAVHTWHHMKVEAVGSTFRCYLDGNELTTAPIVDTDLPTGHVGVYSFRFDIGGLEFLVDDLVLTSQAPVRTENASWGKVKSLYR